eukprot:m.246439 g.246439  ORF g.246439 m.246439 type:complete len:153 (-) comp17476_c0_seq3:2244-2702(-)
MQRYNRSKSFAVLSFGFANDDGCCREEDLRLLQERMDAAISQQGFKNTTILSLSYELCRRLEAVHLISCKSAKDRTGMQVTLDQATTLVQRHQLPFSQLQVALDTLRARGARIENVNMNTGKRVFAFDDSQVNEHLPYLLKPIKGIYGKNKT